MRLLHPGVNTADIITQYISAVKVCMYIHVYSSTHMHVQILILKFTSTVIHILLSRIIRVNS